jgi:AraC family L-rhamnose operon regulatory protein RhaS
LLESRNPRLDKSLPSSERTVRLFLASLRDCLDGPWTLDSMAAACGLGRAHFASYCRKLVNVAPVEYLTRCRLEAASRMLTDNPGMSITLIAFRCGFQSSQYFARIFRKHHDHPPRSHRGRMA